jgi:hypothetical protein
MSASESAPHRNWHISSDGRTVMETKGTGSEMGNKEKWENQGWQFEKSRDSEWDKFCSYRV